MGILSLLILVSVIALISIMIDRRWQARQQTQLKVAAVQVTPDPPPTVTFTERWTSRIRGLSDRFAQRKQPDAAEAPAESGDEAQTQSMKAA